MSNERHRFLLFAGIYIVLWLATWFSASLLDILGSASLWFLPAGLRFSCLLLLGWPGLLLELSMGLIMSLLKLAWSSSPLPVNLSPQLFWLFYDWLVFAIAYAVVVLPLRRLIRDDWDLTRPVHSVLFIAAALLASMLSALAGTYRLVAVDIIAKNQWTEVATSWFIGDFIGIIILAPLLLVRVWPHLRRYLTQGRWAALTAPMPKGHAVDRRADLFTVVVVGLALLLVFGIPYFLAVKHQVPLIALLLLLPLISVALRYNLRGALLAVVLLDSGLVLMITLFQQRELALQYQLVMIAIALVGLLLGGAVESRNRHLARNQDFASVSNDLLWETNTKGRFISVSGRLAKHMASSPGQFWKSFLKGVSAEHLAMLENALAQQQPFRHLEIAIQSKSATPRWIHINGLPVWNESGELTGYRGTASDVTRAHRAKALMDNFNQELLAEVAQRTLDLRQSHAELIIKEQHLQVLLAAAPVGVLELDTDDRCSYLNVNGSTLTGCPPEQALGCHVLEFVHPEDRGRVEEALISQRKNHDVQWLEFRLNLSNVWCVAYWIRLRQVDQSQDGTIMVLADSTARRQQDERLWTLAHQDPLTNLPNRNLFWDRCTHALSLAKRRDCGAAMLWLDLDGFKSVNDRLGHAAGDALLQQVAQRLKGRIRDSDTVARMGGDEFAVIMPDISDIKSALQVANELVASLADVFELAQGPAHISASIGVALYPQHADSVESLTQCADMAMYSAKHAGKNQVQVCTQASQVTG